MKGINFYQPHSTGESRNPYRENLVMISFFGTLQDSIFKTPFQACQVFSVQGFCNVDLPKSSFEEVSFHSHTYTLLWNAIGSLYFDVYSDNLPSAQVF